MSYYDDVKAAADAVRARVGDVPPLAIVLGSGLGDFAASLDGAVALPYADLPRPMGYPDMYPPEDDSYRPLAVARTMFLDRFDRGVAEVVMQHLAASDAPMRAAQFRVLGGAVARVPDEATAYAHRSSAIMTNLAIFYDGPENYAEREAWVLDFMRDLQQDDRGAYVNFLVDEPERVQAAYPGATYDRLARIKARYDPDNLFRMNQNIPPAE